MQATPVPAYRVAAGHLVLTPWQAGRLLALKAERQGKDHVNHFLVPLDPWPDRRSMRLLYLDPETALLPVAGMALAFSPRADGDGPEVGDAIDTGSATWLKVLDDPQSQRLFCYVEVGSGLVRPRMERHAHRTLVWRMDRLYTGEPLK